MKGDFSRNTFNPEKHYRSVLKQQGRVDVDADWNEQQAISMRRIETEATDVIGHCGAPLHDAGFHIVTDLKDLTDEEKSLEGNNIPQGSPISSPAPSGDFLISAGRYYVDGVLCENEQIGLYSNQSDLPSPLDIGKLLVDAKTTTGIVYLDVWQRHITALDDPLIREKALGGPDSATRLKTIGQVKVLPVASATFDPKPVKTVLKELVTVIRSIVKDFTLPPTAIKKLEDLEANRTAFLQATGTGNSAQSLQSANNILSLLLNLKLPSQVITAFGDQINAINGDLGKLLEAVGKITCDSQLDEWESLIKSGTGKLNAHTQPPDPSEQPCLLPPSAGYQRLENQLYRVEILQVNKDGTPISFVWSRDNGTVVTTIKSISGNNIVVANVGPDDMLGFANGQWVEVVNDEMELKGIPGQLLQLDSDGVNEATHTITVGVPPDLQGANLPGNPKLRRWDQTGNAATKDGVLITFDWQPLEDGIEVNFTKGTYKPGDYWLIPARTATGDIEWPQDQANPPQPLAQPPLGIQHHYCRLALITAQPANGFARSNKLQIEVIEDCRCVFPPLCGMKPAATEEPVIQIQSVALIGGEFQRQPPVAQIDEFEKGIVITCTEGVTLEQNNYFLGLTKQGFRPQPACFVTLQLPYALEEFNMRLNVNAKPTFGYQPFILNADVTIKENRILWKPLITDLLRDLMIKFKPPQILACLTLKGNYIWGSQNGGPKMYLDGESFADPESKNSTGLILPHSGDGRRGGDFEMWFWLVP